MWRRLDRPKIVVIGSASSRGLVEGCAQSPPGDVAAERRMVRATVLDCEDFLKRVDHSVSPA